MQCIEIKHKSALLTYENEACYFSSMFTFSKPEGWQSLSADDKTFFRDLKKGGIPNALIDAVREGKDARVSFILKSCRDLIDEEAVQAAAAKAIKIGNKEILQVVLYEAPFRMLAKSKHGSSRLHLLLDNVGEKRDLDMWKMICTWMNRVASKQLDATISDNERAGRAAAMNWRDGILYHLEDVNKGNLRVYQSVVSGMCSSKAKADDLTWLFSTYRNSFVPDVMQETLDKCLANACHGGRIDTARILMDEGASHQFDNFKPVYYAAKNIETGMLVYLIDRVGIEQIDTRKVYEYLEHDIKQSYSSMTREKIDAVRAVFDTALKPKYTGDNRFALVTKDTLAEIQELPDGARLTILFNFALRQQMVVMQTPDLPPSAPAITNFDDIKNHQAIVAAGDKLIALGGDAQAVMPSRNRVLPLQK